METTMPDDQLANDWLNSNITSGMPVVLEAPGKPSYTDYERVSAMTGLPTVLGWYDHEWLWKSDTSILNKREADIKEIYTNTDMATVRLYLEKYNVSYIYVGKLEQEKYPSINHELLKSLGEVVFMSPADGTKSYETSYPDNYAVLHILKAYLLIPGLDMLAISTLIIRAEWRYFNVNKGKNFTYSINDFCQGLFQSDVDLIRAFYNLCINYGFPI